MNRKFYEYINNNDKNLANQIDNHKILGASKQIEIISKIIKNMVEENRNLSLEKLKSLIKNVNDYYLETRGKSSRAFYNSLKEINSVIEYNTNDYDKFLYSVNKSIENYNSSVKKNLDLVLKYAKNELEENKSIFLYDYSSTVEKVIQKLSQETNKCYNIYI